MVVPKYSLLSHWHLESGKVIDRRMQDEAAWKYPEASKDRQADYPCIQRAEREFCGHLVNEVSRTSQRPCGNDMPRGF
jgi:hypothetical protein